MKMKSSNTTSFTQKTTSKKPMKARKNRKCSQKHKPKHPVGWTKKIHYMCLGGQCGQSCPCCRAEAFLQGRDPDGHWGACTICLG